MHSKKYLGTQSGTNTEDMLHMWSCIARNPPFLHYSAQDSPSHTTSLQVILLASTAQPWEVQAGVRQGLNCACVQPQPVSWGCHSVTDSLGSGLRTKLWGLQRDSTSLLFQTNSHVDVKILLPHSWAEQGLRWWRSLILFINCYCLSSGNASNSFFFFLTGIYIFALSKGWSNIDSGYKSHQQVNRCTVCERELMRGKKVWLKQD